MRDIHQIYIYTLFLAIQQDSPNDAACEPLDTFALCSLVDCHLIQIHGRWECAVESTIQEVLHCMHRAPLPTQDSERTTQQSLRMDGSPLETTLQGVCRTLLLGLTHKCVFHWCWCCFYPSWSSTSYQE